MALCVSNPAPSPWLCDKASASRTGDTGITTQFPWSSHTSKLKKGTLVANSTGVTGSVLGLVGTASVYYDWVR